MEEEIWIKVEGEGKGVRIGGKAGWMIGDIASVLTGVETHDLCLHTWQTGGSLRDMEGRGQLRASPGVIGILLEALEEKFHREVMEESHPQEVTEAPQKEGLPLLKLTGSTRQERRLKN